MTERHIKIKTNNDTRFFDKLKKKSLSKSKSESKSESKSRSESKSKSKPKKKDKLIKLEELDFYNSLIVQIDQNGKINKTFLDKDKDLDDLIKDIKEMDKFKKQDKFAATLKDKKSIQKLKPGLVIKPTLPLRPLKIEQLDQTTKSKLKAKQKGQQVKKKEQLPVIKQIENYIKTSTYDKYSIIGNIEDYIGNFNKTNKNTLKWDKLKLPNNAAIIGIIYNETLKYGECINVYQKLIQANKKLNIGQKQQTLLIYNDNSEKYFKFTSDVHGTSGNGILRNFRSDILPQNDKARNDEVYVLGVPLNEKEEAKFKISIVLIRSFIIKFNINIVFFYSDIEFNIGTEIFDNKKIDTTNQKKIFKEELVDLFDTKILTLSSKDDEKIKKLKTEIIGDKEIIIVNDSIIFIKKDVLY